MNNSTSNLYTTPAQIFSAAGAFITESLEQMIPWLIVMFSVVICDLIAGVRRGVMIKEEVRFSRAWRATMGKMVTYFSFVVMVVLINRASGGSYAIDKWSVLLVCFIEFSSILSNILKPMGYELDVLAFLRLLLRKVFGSMGEELTKVITRKDKVKKGDDDENKGNK